MEISTSQYRIIELIIHIRLAPQEGTCFLGRIPIAACISGKRITACLNVKKKIESSAARGLTLCAGACRWRTIVRTPLFLNDADGMNLIYSTTCNFLARFMLLQRI